MKLRMKRWIVVDVEEMVEYIWQMGTNRALPVPQISAHRKDIRKDLTARLSASIHPFFLLPFLPSSLCMDLGNSVDSSGKES